MACRASVFLRTSVPGECRGRAANWFQPSSTSWVATDCLALEAALLAVTVRRRSPPRACSIRDGVAVATRIGARDANAGHWVNQDGGCASANAERLTNRHIVSLRFEGCDDFVA